MAQLWLWFLLVPVVIHLSAEGIAFGVRWHTTADGRKISRKDFIKEVRWIFDRHDTRYQIGGWDKRIPPLNASLYEAAEAGEIETVRQLLQAGAVPDELNMHGWTALMIAVANQHEEIAALLFDYGANPNIANLLGRTPLMFAARYGNEKLVRALLTHGADPNHNQSEDPGALSSAAYIGHLAIVELLLANGADPRKKDFEGQRAENYAEKAGHGEIAALLRRARHQLSTPGT